eukprot:1134611-Pelagomonas_calceolata.AAC.3
MQLEASRCRLLFQCHITIFSRFSRPDMLPGNWKTEAEADGTIGIKPQLEYKSGGTCVRSGWWEVGGM